MAFDSSGRPTNNSDPRAFPASAGFSLIELLVIIAILAILTVIASVGMNQVLSSTRIEQAGRTILDEINLARQIAAARNLNVELRFIEKTRTDNPSGDSVFYAVQSGVLDKTNPRIFNPVTRLSQLPSGMIMASEKVLSSILGALPKTNSPDPAYNYVSIVIRPTGALEPKTGLSLNEPWFVTAISERDAGKGGGDLKNFVTIQIDPWTSRPTYYRP